MESIGQTLRDARERLGLTLEEVERAIRIRIRYLEWIEEGDLEQLPSPVQARGFLHNYAEFLGLDSSTLLLSYADALQARRKRRRANSDPLVDDRRYPVTVRSRVPRWLSPDLYLAVGISVAVIAVLVWGANGLMQSVSQGDEARSELAAAVPAQAIPSALPTATLEQAALAFLETSLPVESPVEAIAETPASNAIIGPGFRVALGIEVIHPAWLTVIVDGEEQIRGRVELGQILEFQALEQIELTTGNAGGLRVSFNGSDLGVLGAMDEVVIMIWKPEGMLTPTPTVTPTPTETLPATATATVTPTPLTIGVP